MYSTKWTPYRLICRAVVMSALVSAFGWSTASVAQANEPVMAVEEDWELVVGTPDWNTESPQITCVISPIGSMHTVHCAFDLNHHSQPSYSAGGMQLQIWNGESPVSRKEFSERGLLRHTNETITWTARMALEVGLDGGANQLGYEINHGHSWTWNGFGGNGTLRTSVNSLLTDLNLYDSSISTTHSGVNYAFEQVASLKLVEVRRYNILGQLISVDTTERVVHPKPE